MPPEWSKQILSLVQPLAYAAVVRRLSRSDLLAWASVLEGVAREMREKAGEARS